MTFAVMQPVWSYICDYYDSGSCAKCPTCLQLWSGFVWYTVYCISQQCALSIVIQYCYLCRPVQQSSTLLYFNLLECFFFGMRLNLSHLTNAMSDLDALSSPNTQFIQLNIEHYRTVVALYPKPTSIELQCNISKLNTKRNTVFSNWRDGCFSEHFHFLGRKSHGESESLSLSELGHYHCYPLYD